MGRVEAWARACARVAVALGIAGVAVGAGAGCWEDRGPCELWGGKLARNEEPSVAIRQLQEARCEGKRGLLLERAADPTLGGDALAALIALGRSPEAEQAVRGALGRAATVGVAAKQVVAWKLAAAEPDLQRAFADPTLAGHRDDLLAAALAVAPPDHWIGPIAARIGGADGARALSLLGAIDWARVTPEARAAAVAALRGPAAAGDDAALDVLVAADAAAAAEVARPLVTKAGVAPGLRALALGLVATAPPEAAVDLAAMVATAPTDGDVLDGLALAGGERVVAALEARLEAEKGGTRAAVSRALAFALPIDRLDAWEAGLRAHASMLLRAVPDDPTVRAVVALRRRCSVDAACYAAVIREATPGLGRLDAELASAREALRAAEARAQAAVGADAQRAQELAQATGEAVAAARAELEAIGKRRDAAYAEVAPASAAVDAASARITTTVVALRALVPGGDAAVAKAARDACVGAACAPVRAWAAAVVRSAGR